MSDIGIQQNWEFLINPISFEIKFFAELLSDIGNIQMSDIGIHRIVWKIVFRIDYISYGKKYLRVMDHKLWSLKYFLKKR